MFTSATFEAAIIVFREGLEAVLMLAALSTFLTRMSASERKPLLLIGAALGVMVAFGLGYALEGLSSLSNSPYMDAALVFISAGLMIYLSGWLWARRGASWWQQFMQRRADDAIFSKTGVAVGVLAFLIALREGSEVVIFLRMIARPGGGAAIAIFSGVLAGLAILGLVFYLLRFYSERTSLRVLFVVTSFWLFFFALKFSGEGIDILQSAHLISRSVVPNAAFMDRMGLNPTWEAVILQLAVIAAALTGFSAAMRDRSVIQR